MHVRVLLLVAAFTFTGCGGSEAPDEPAEPPAPAAARESVFDPWVGTVDRAKAVQETLDEQAAELRRRVEEAER